MSLEGLGRESEGSLLCSQDPTVGHVPDGCRHTSSYPAGLRLALSNGPSRVGAPSFYPMTETDPVSETLFVPGIVSRNESRLIKLIVCVSVCP
jgi:hypothetical protein